ncbi:MAG: complex I NDUFA9 subunit family protein [Parvularculaceae bacterium]
MAGDLAVVFGGSGFVGRNVARELARRGWRVRVAVRRPHHAQFLRTMGVVGQIQLVQTNIRHQGSIAEALKGADAVVNCIGILSQDGAQSFEAVQAGGAAALARLAAEAGVRRFVQVSAIGADAQGESLYARSKGEGERAVREALPFATIVRPSIIFGPEDRFFNKFATMFSFAPPFAPIPILIGGGGTRMQPVYVDDVAEAICETLARPGAVGKTYELGGPRVYSFKELLELLLSVTGQSRLLVPLPWAVAPAAGLFGECLGLLPFLDPPITRDQIKMLKKDNVVGAGGASVLTFADLGLSPKAVEAILPGYIARFRKYGQFAEKAA